MKINSVHNSVSFGTRLGIHHSFKRALKDAGICKNRSEIKNLCKELKSLAKEGGDIFDKISLDTIDIISARGVNRSIAITKSRLFKSLDNKIFNLNATKSENAMELIKDTVKSFVK